MPFAGYLSRLEILCPLTPLEPPTTRGPPSPPLDEVASPAKRPRSDSPENSGAPSEAAASLLDSASQCLSPTSTSFSSCVRSILSPSSSPPPSRSASRRSSTGRSSKSVRFARCTNASVYPALSGEEYDRTPIVPSTEAESLNLPKRDCDGTVGWIKCVERARVAEKERKAAAAAAIAAGESPAAVRVPTAARKHVEGVHGLVDGGYFVGDEHSTASSDDEEAISDTEVDDIHEDDGMVVDDEEDGGESPNAPSLVHDDVSEDSDSVPSVTSDTSAPVVRIPSPLPAAKASFLSVFQPSLTVAAVAAIGDKVGDLSVSEHAAAVAAELERKRKCRERYGICALGKYTRAEVFQSYDSLGGF